MRCVSWLLLGTFLLALGPAVHGAPGQCPDLCHCHGDLQHVICDGVGLKRIPRVSEVTRLLNLQRNNLGAIPTGAFGDSKGLISLHMQHCQLREIGSQAFKGLKKLVYLYLSNNKISSIRPGAFEDLTELTYLYLDGNQIGDLARGLFSPMINLFILQLNDNRLRELRPGTFAGAKDLRWLHMSGNDLTTLQPGSLDDVENLALLHLDRNRLSSYPIAAMSKLRVVEELTLGKNPMRTIPDIAFQSFGRYMEKLHLDNMGLEKETGPPRTSLKHLAPSDPHEVEAARRRRAVTVGVYITAGAGRRMRGGFHATDTLARFPHSGSIRSSPMVRSQA
ncbi:chondroadherin isoform 2-T3 [Spinachia spinachia]